MSKTNRVDLIGLQAKWRREIIIKQAYNKCRLINCDKQYEEEESGVFSEASSGLFSQNVV